MSVVVYNIKEGPHFPLSPRLLSSAHPVVGTAIGPNYIYNVFSDTFTELIDDEDNGLTDDVSNELIL